MKVKMILAFLISCVSLLAQPQMELTASGFAPVTLLTPAKPFDKLMDAAKSWASYYNKKGADVYDVTSSSLSIDAYREHGLFYRNLGERYDYNIVYTLKVAFLENKTYTISFSVKEIYAKNVLTKTSIADYFAPDGRLKEDFEEVKPSLENTAQKIVGSFSDFIAR